MACVFFFRAIGAGAEVTKLLQFLGNTHEALMDGVVNCDSHEVRLSDRWKRRMHPCRKIFSMRILPANP